MSVLRRCATGHRPRAAGRDRAAKKVPGAIGRSAPWSNRQIGSTPYWFDSCAARCSPRSATRPVELRPVSRRRPQHAVDPAQLPGSPAPKWAILSASVVEGPWPACPVDLGLGHASFNVSWLIQSCSPIRTHAPARATGSSARIDCQPDRPIPRLLRALPRCRHAPTFRGLLVSIKPGTGQPGLHHQHIARAARLPTQPGTARTPASRTGSGPGRIPASVIYPPGTTTSTRSGSSSR